MYREYHRRSTSSISLAAKAVTCFLLATSIFPIFLVAGVIDFARLNPRAA